MAATLTAPITMDEFARLPRDGARHEISEGELITMPPPKSLHDRVVSALSELLAVHLRRHSVYRAFPGAGYILSRDPLTIRQPDVSLLSKQRVEATDPDDYFEGAPEIAIEVVSPSDPAQDLEIKIEQYFRAGAQQVWVVYPKTQRVHVHYADRRSLILSGDETLAGGDLLPGFSIKTADLFQ